MDAALIVSAFALGAAGSPHCALMCGAAQHGIARSCGAGATGGYARTAVALQVGRLLGYAGAGALLAGGVSLLGAMRAASPVLGSLWTMVQVAAVVYGGLLVWTGRQPTFLSGDRRPAGALAGQAAPLRFVAYARGPAGAGAAGFAWALVPCGLLQSALLVAALASGPLQGGAVMASFALASSLGLWLAPQLWQRLQVAGGGERWTTLAVRGAGLLLAAASIAALAHRLGRAADGSWCLT